MDDPFLGEIRLFAFGFAPRGWAACNGQILPIAQNQALFALLGTMYGGDGRTTFALPNFQGRVPMHFLPDSAPGGRGGEETHQLTANEIPPHTHPLQGSAAGPAQGSPTGGFWPANNTLTPYAAASDGSTMSPGAVMAGASQPHPNLPPYVTVFFAIAVQGVFPSRS